MDEEKLLAFLLAARDVILTPFAYLTKGIGTVIRPALPYLQNGFVQLLMLIVFMLLVHFLLFDRKGKRHTMSKLDYEVKMNAFPLTAAFLLGMYFKSASSMMFDTNLGSVVTFFNFMEWPWEAQMYLILLTIAGIIITVLYCFYSVRFAVRFLCCLCLAALAGNLYMSAYLVIGMAADEWRGIFRLLKVAAGVFHSVFQGVVAGPVLFATFCVMLKPLSVIMKEAERRRKLEEWKRNRKQSSGSTDGENDENDSEAHRHAINVFDLPSTIYDSYNNTYVQTMITSRYAEYQCVETQRLVKIPNGRISTSSARSADGEHFHF